MSKLPKRTPWFPASVKPVRVGVYEVQFETVKGSGLAKTRKLYFDGWTWRYYAGLGTSFSQRTRDQWRGLVRKAD